MAKQFSLLLSFLVLSAFVQSGVHAYASEITLNGEETTVYFNDGDTFKVLSGPLKGKSSRLNGFNTLEAYGPVHHWGSFTTKDLQRIADAGTKVAQKGGWHCTTDGSVDTYKRILSTCSDLGAKLVSTGLAHVLSVTKEPGDAALVKLQRKAIQDKKGMWAKGTPAFILSSLHSADEKDDGSEVYNRAVSTLDGHSELIRHHNAYEDCEEVCYAPTQGDLASCMIYVKFENRYGSNRATCLKN